MTGDLTRRPRIFLTEDEEKVLVARMLVGDAVARARLIEAHIPLAARQARRYARLACADDLTSEAMVGLIKAADHFDPARGVRFATCALFWIRDALCRFARSNYSVVARPSSNRAKLSFSEQLRDGALVFDLALDAPVSGTSKTSRLELLPDPCATDEEGVAEMMERRRRIDAVRRATSRLSPRERQLIERRHLTQDLEVPTLQALADELGVSRQRVQQIEDEALRKLISTVRRTAMVQAVHQLQRTREAA